MEETTVRPIDANEILSNITVYHARLVSAHGDKVKEAMLEVAANLVDQTRTIPGNVQVLRAQTRSIRPINANVLRRKIVKMYNSRAKGRQTLEVMAEMWILRMVQQVIDTAGTLPDEFMNEYTRG